jgi:hypothetical protein
MKLLLYTHTDCKDIWRIFFNQIDKYLPHVEKIILVNKDNNDIPAEYQKIFYDDNLNYTKRIAQCLDKLQNEIVLFIHEDMILFENVDFNKINDFIELIKNNKADFIKLIKVDIGNDKTEYYPNLIKTPQELMFSVQPTICESNKLKNIFSLFDCNIWDFEKKVYAACLHFKYFNCFMASTNKDKKRGLFHYDSNIFPYIATAIVKGKWNYNEYKNELDILFDKYKINKDERGIA